MAARAGTPFHTITLTPPRLHLPDLDVEGLGEQDARRRRWGRLAVAVAGAVAERVLLPEEQWGALVSERWQRGESCGDVRQAAEQATALGAEGGAAVLWWLERGEAAAWGWLSSHAADLEALARELDKCGRLTRLEVLDLLRPWERWAGER